MTDSNTSPEFFAAQREVEIRERAKKFAMWITIGQIPLEIDCETLSWLKDEEIPTFERYCVRFGMFKRSDGKWQRRPPKISF